MVGVTAAAAAGGVVVAAASVSVFVSVAAPAAGVFGVTSVSVVVSVVTPAAATPGVVVVVGVVAGLPGVAGVVVVGVVAGVAGVAVVAVVVGVVAGFPGVAGVVAVVAVVAVLASAAPGRVAGSNTDTSVIVAPFGFTEKNVVVTGTACTQAQAAKSATSETKTLFLIVLPRWSVEYSYMEPLFYVLKLDDCCFSHFYFYYYIQNIYVLVENQILVAFLCKSQNYKKIKIKNKKNKSKNAVRLETQRNLNIF